MKCFYMSHVFTPISWPNNNTSTIIPFVYPLEPLGKTIMPFPLAIDETAFDLLKPAGTTVATLSSIYQIARTKRVKGFFLGKSSPNTAFILGIYGVVQPIIPNIAGRANNSNPVKQADGVPDRPNKSLSPTTATVVTLPGRIITLSNKTFAPIRS